MNDKLNYISNEVKNGALALRLGFGTSRLHHLRSSRARQELLAVALQHGIKYFDTAPSYGDGMAERELGRFLKGCSERVVIATKYGIPPSAIIDRMPILALPLQSLRGILRKTQILNDVRLPQMSAVGLRSSLESSLRRLGQNHVDILFLHEPAPNRIQSFSSLVAEAVRLKDEGLIRAFGFAGAYQNILSLTQKKDCNLIIQTGEYEWNEGDNLTPDITYGAMSLGAQSYFRKQPAPFAIERLRSALSRRASGAVLVSTTNVQHLLQMVKTANDLRGSP